MAFKNKSLCYIEEESNVKNKENGTDGALCKVSGEHIEFDLMILMLGGIS